MGVDKKLLQETRETLKRNAEGMMIAPQGFVQMCEALMAEIEKHDTERPSHEQVVQALVKDPHKLLSSLTPAKVDLWHMATGVSGEAGELLDWVKKHVVYDQPLGTKSKEGKTIQYHILEEMADAWFYMKRIMLTFGWSVEDLESFVIKKLLDRYEGMVYTDEAAKVRKDKA